MSRRKLRECFPALLLAALAALLVSAPLAAAATMSAEGTSPESPALSGEVDLVKATATFDSGTGATTFTLTTREPAGSDPAGEGVAYIASMFATAPCPVGGAHPPAVAALAESPLVSGGAAFVGPSGEIEEEPPLTPSASGATVTLAFTAPSASGQSFTCALFVTQADGGREEDQITFSFGGSGPPTSSVPGSQTPDSQAAPLSAAGPLAISITKPQPLKLKVGQSRMAKVKVTNTGSTATAQGSLRVKPVAGVLVKPEKQKLPVLAPGASWAVTVRVELTAKAKKKSTLSLTGTASGVSAKGSLVVKRME